MDNSERTVVVVDTKNFYKLMQEMNDVFLTRSQTTFLAKWEKSFLCSFCFSPDSNRFFLLHLALAYVYVCVLSSTKRTASA